MQRLIISVVTIVVLGACGSGDDAPGSASTDSATTTEAPTDAAATTTAGNAEPTSPTTTGEVPDEQSDDETSDETIEVGSFSDLPPECVDLFRQFLRDLEPVVSAIDWQAATMAEFETLGTDFEDLGTDFEAESTRLGCDRFDLSDDAAGLDEMIEFARTEAPGTVAFFEFLDDVRSVVPGSSDSGETDPDAPATCDEAVAEIESLVEEYGTMADVPASELPRIGQVMTGLTTVCSIDELSSILEREDLAAFLDG